MSLLYLYSVIFQFVTDYKKESKKHIIDGIIQEVQLLLQENNQQVCDENISNGRARILK